MPDTQSNAPILEAPANHAGPGNVPIGAPGQGAPPDIKGITGAASSGADPATQKGVDDRCGTPDPRDPGMRSPRAAA